MFGISAGINAKIGACVLSIGPLIGILHGLSLQIFIQMCYPFSYLHASGTLAITKGFNVISTLLLLYRLGHDRWLSNAAERRVMLVHLIYGNTRN